MQKYRYYLPPRSKLPFAAGILAGLMTLNTIYTLISMPYYTHYWDYWATMVSGILLCGFCFLFRNRHAELTLIPAAMLALIACITPNLIHWMEVGLFFLSAAGMAGADATLDRQIVPSPGRSVHPGRRHRHSVSHGRAHLLAGGAWKRCPGVCCPVCYPESGRRPVDFADLCSCWFRHAAPCPAGLDG